MLARAAGRFASDLTLETATTKAASLALLDRTSFDLIIACETLGDGWGLEVLSHAAVQTPNTLRIFAARPSTLKLLKGELGLFGLFRTLPYPINFRYLWASLNLARSCCAEVEPGKTAVRDVVSQGEWQTDVRVVEVRKPVPPPAKKVAAAGVTWRPSAEQKLALQAPARQAPARHASAPKTPVAHASARPMPVPEALSRRDPARHAPAQQMLGREPRPQQRAAANTPLAPIPESEAFKRARALRNAAKLGANSRIAPTDLNETRQLLGEAVDQVHPAGDRRGRRREPAVSNESLAQLAQLATTKRPTYGGRGNPGSSKRTAFLVGSGVFAAGTAAVLTFTLVNANNSMVRSPLPLVASIERPVPQKVFPWQPPAQESQQPTPPTPSARSEAPSATAADLDVEAEAASETFPVEPDHPGPPQPNPPPGPSEPPSSDSNTAQWVDE